MARNTSSARTAPGKIFKPLLWALAALLGANGGAGAQTLPRWEVGVGLGVLSLPFYRGADGGRTYVIPLPYLQYRGEHLRVDEEGIRSRLFRSDDIRLDFSLAAGIPVPSGVNSARRGMPALSPTVEIGPSLEFLLWRAEPRDRALWLKLPARAALSVDWRDIAYQGWIFAPYAEYRTIGKTATGPWTVSLSLGPQFAARRYHDYFYEVEPAYAAAARPEYHPDAGYSGSRITIGMQKWLGASYWLGAFLRYDDLHGAVFADSPLVQQMHYYAVGATIIKLLAVSSNAAPNP